MAARRPGAPAATATGGCATSWRPIRATSCSRSSEDELLRIALGILHLYRPAAGEAVRRAATRSTASSRCCCSCPRERYDAGCVERAGAHAGRGLRRPRLGLSIPAISDAPLARVHYIIGVTPGAHPEPDLAALEAAIAEAARTWATTSRRRCAPAPDRRRAPRAPRPLRPTPSRPAIATSTTPPRPLADIARDRAAGRRRADRACAPIASAERPPRSFRFKLYRADATPRALADVLPILDNMGLKALVEEGFAHRAARATAARRTVWIARVPDARTRDGERLGFDDDAAALRGRLRRRLDRPTESDGFNRLVLELGVSWREAALIRALARYRQQSGLDPSQAGAGGGAERPSRGGAPDPGAVRGQVRPGRSAVTARPAARRAEAVLRARSSKPCRRSRAWTPTGCCGASPALAPALVRTNYYQSGADGRPSPTSASRSPRASSTTCRRPSRSARSSSGPPHVEGVHLRFGPVARGGLRWSDRRDDFRTEVLGLVKAQQVKNAVIVPVGSKGGFYPKQLPRGGAPDAVTRRGGARLPHLPVRPARPDRQPRRRRPGDPPAAGVVVLDDDDPYLVVAADKGTASFSDIANGVAEDYGFWLGDAFASGGSAGYDHKAMGITARGAWEAVKRHFRELRQGHPERAVHRHRRRRHVRRRVRQRHAAVAADPAARRLRPPRHLHRPQTPTLRPRSPSASGCSPCRARPGPTTTRR